MTKSDQYIARLLKEAPTTTKGGVPIQIVDGGKHVYTFSTRFKSGRDYSVYNPTDYPNLFGWPYKDFEMSGNGKLGLPRTAMREIVIAFDIDGTLRSNLTATSREVNGDVVELARLLKKMKNTKLVAWSGGGSNYAQSFIDSDKRLQAIFGRRCYGKVGAAFVPDIAIDDIQDTALGAINLIVREK